MRPDIGKTVEYIRNLCGIFVHSPTSYRYRTDDMPYGVYPFLSTAVQGILHVHHKYM